MRLARCALLPALLGQLLAVQAMTNSSLQSIVSSTLSSLTSAITMDACPLVSNVVDAVTNNLRVNIAGQEEATEVVVRAVAAWELTRRSSSGRPLVMAFTGPTGVGKSESSYRIAEALLASKRQLGRRLVPEGMLVLRGEDYSATSKIAALGVGEIHKHISAVLQEHFARCGGNAVVVFDEVQKVVPGALEALNQLLGDRGSVTVPVGKSYLCSVGFGCSSTTEISTANAVFILISDIALDTMVKALLAYRERKNIPQTIMRGIVKDALDAQWERLQFGKHITEVVPFLPLERTHVQQVFALKVRQLGLEYRFKYWWNLVVDPAVVEYLSGPRYIKYSAHSTTVVRRGGGDGDGEVSQKVFSTYGARSIENAGPLQDLRSKIYSHMQPWQSQRLLHVGLAGTTEVLLLMQWCVPDIRMFGSVAEGREIEIDTATARSDRCTTVWTGPPMG